ncbi:MAG: SIS domain-containing protein [Myxococcota bacterium]
MSSTIGRYFEEFQSVVQHIPEASIESTVGTLFDAYLRQAQVFIAGNGGSAAAASHLACDLQKTAGFGSAKGFRVLSLGDNIASLTAWANDEGYRSVFAEQMSSFANEGDVLLVISCSGNSPNVVEAVRRANELGLTSIGWIGFDGGAVRDLTSQQVHIPSYDYGIVEGAHGVLAHLVTSWLQKLIKRADQQPQDRFASSDSLEVSERLTRVRGSSPNTEASSTGSEASSTGSESINPMTSRSKGNGNSEPRAGVPQ